MARQTIYGDPIAYLGGDPVEFEVEDIADFENDYVCKDQVACHLRHCHQKHNRGMIVRLSIGGHSFLGNRCARKHMGAERFDQLASQLKVAQRVELVRSNFSNPDFRPDRAREILHSFFETAKVVDEVQRHFRAHHDYTWSTLVGIAAGPGILASCRVRRGRLEYGHYDGWDDWHVRRTLPEAKKPSDLLQGRDFFLHPTVGGSYMMADRVLDGLEVLFAGNIDPNEKRMLSVPTEIREARRLVSNVIRGCNGYVEFCEPENLRAVGKWMARVSRDGARVERNAEGLVIYRQIGYSSKRRAETIPLPKVEEVDPKILELLSEKPLSLAA
jgi:hypothetical protein